VGGCALFRGCSAGFLDRLASALRERDLDAETVVFRAGEACKELVIISSGFVDTYEEVAASVAGGPGGEEVSDSLGPGDTLAEVSFVFGIRHFKTARVSRHKKVLAFVLSAEAYRELLKAFPSQEDVVMDNAMHQYEGMTTARSHKSKLSVGGASSAGGSSHRSGSEKGSDKAPSASGQSDVGNGKGGVVSLQKILARAKNKRDELSHARLCSACAKGDFEKVRRLLSARNVDIDYADFDGRRALHLAAAGGSTRVVETPLRRSRRRAGGGGEAPLRPQRPARLT